jgi:hypothetical protein
VLAATRKGYPDPRATNMRSWEVESDPVRRLLALLEDQIAPGAARGFFAAFLYLAYYVPISNRRNLRAKSFRKFESDWLQKIASYAEEVGRAEPNSLLSRKSLGRKFRSKRD